MKKVPGVSVGAEQAPTHSREELNCILSHLQSLCEPFMAPFLVLEEDILVLSIFVVWLFDSRTIACGHFVL